MSAAQSNCLPRRRGYTPLALGMMLGLWLDGQDPATRFQDVARTVLCGPGDPMGGQTDKSPYTLHGFQPTPATCPIIDPAAGNGFGAPVYNGSNTFLVPSPFAGLDEGEVWIVSSSILAFTYQVLYESFDGTLADCLFADRGPGGDLAMIAAGNAGQLSISNLSPFVDSGLHVFRHVFDTKLVSGCSVVTRDGVQVGNQDGDAALLGALMNASHLVLGSRFDGTYGQMGTGAEVIFVRRKQSPAEAYNMLRWLMRKWNIT